MSATLPKIKDHGQKSGLNVILQNRTKRTRLFFLLSGIILIFWGLSARDQSGRENKNIKPESWGNTLILPSGAGIFAAEFFPKPP